MEGVEFVSSARVVTPAVSKLLDQRRKGLCWNVQNSEHVHFNKDAKRGDRENSTLLTVTNAEIIQNPTTRKAHSHGVKEVAKESGSTHADHSRSSTPVFAGASVILEGDDDSDSLSDESSSESPEIASPHSTIATEAASRDPDFPKLSFGFTDACFGAIASPHSTIATEAASRDLDFPKLSFGFTDRQLKPALGSNRPMNATLSQKAEGPFEAFKSLSERWREQDWQDEPSGHFLGVGDWNGTLSLNTVSPGWLDTNTANQRNENVRSGNRSESNSFIGTSSGLFLEGFPPFAAPAAPSLSTPKPSTKNAPPGFTPADAQPLESRAAFERLRNNGNATHAIATTSSTSDGNSLFANKLPLFGPALPPKYDDQVTLGSVGRIGSGRSKVLRGLNTSPTK
ncbi:hypothetical protein PHMEG_0002838 [Phytophthora megakarya]|uniref:Uncharacterized protein n=1 Tax=Phytophthora megakarya TaxID=4795 RepID=A0A225WXK0_9STRA|nr:hypothetical protein PHMEG_0002838 [Phytophthora megakarya]